MTETFSQQIDATRLRYEDVGHGVRVHGHPFILEFDEPVDPEAFCETVSTADDPWRAFGVKLKLVDERRDGSGEVSSPATTGSSPVCCTTSKTARPQTRRK